MLYIIRIGIVGLNILYFFLKLIPTKKKVTMISRQSNNPSIEFLMIRDELNKQQPDTQVTLLCKTLDDGADATFVNKLRYAFHILVQMYHIATSKVVIIDTYCIPVCILNHKKELTVIQIWHSIGTMKKFGYSALDKSEGSKSELAYAMKMHHNYDYIFASSDAYKHHLAEGFHTNIEKIVTMPLPRVDLLKSKTYENSIKEKIYDKYPELKEKPTIVYCPTFRKDESKFEEAVYKLVENTDTTNYNLVIKLHPLSKVKLSEAVYTASEFSSFDMLFVADYVISDYSCIVYEAAVRNIPLYFYNFDMDMYLEGRGLAIDYYKELPGVISGEALEIIKAIENQPYDMKKLKHFTDKYVMPVENATANIVTFINTFLT